jgi:penicillin-binding protein 1A
MARERPKRDKAQSRGWFSKLWRIGLFVVLGLLVALFIAVGVAWSSLPDYSQLRTREALGQVIRVRAADGSIIVKLGPVFGEWIEYKNIPSVMVDAMVAVEDKRFRSHLGVDPLGLARAAQIRVQKGRWLQGGSTITQQLARNIFLTNTKTFARKAREMILALAMERKYSKDQILELYLNRVYFGGGAYGIDAASRLFFEHSATQLNLPESAIVAGLVKAPSNYSPTADAKAAFGRAGVVLDIMLKQGKISESDIKSVGPGQVKLAVAKQQNNVRYFTDWALPQLDTMIDETAKPLDVWTTIDLRMQDAADKAIRAHTPGNMQGALVSLDRDGAVRAMVGGKDYVSSIYNRSTQAVRQPGSSFKLFVYLAALEAGKTAESKMVDKPIDIGGWKPRNSSGHYSGEITLRTAFTYSINTIAAQIGAEVGTSTISAMARRFGITTPVNTQPSMVLGTSDTRLIDMTRAYAAVSAKGRSVTPYGIVKVTTTNGALLYARKPTTQIQLVEPWVASAMTDLLQSAVATGTGKAAQIGRPVAGKTGTTQSNKDGWFLGFSSGLTTGVWMGRDDARPVTGLQGGKAPATAFSAYMRVATATRPVEQFETSVKMPEWVVDTEEQAYIKEPKGGGSLVDGNGNLLPEDQPATIPQDQGGDMPPPLDDKFIQDAIKPDDQAPPPNQ